MSFPIEPPIEPMLARLAESLPEDSDFLFEPKWDGFRAIVFRGESELYIQSRDLKPLDRYFPDLHQSLLDLLPSGCVIDGEIVIVAAHGLDFDAPSSSAPAQSRTAKPARETLASFSWPDALAVGGSNTGDAAAERRANLGQLLKR
jgi:ATP-dependent DNA ligase